MNNEFLMMLVNSIDVFFLVFARIVGIFMVAPFFSRTQVSSFVKVGLSMIVSYSILPFLIYQTNINYTFYETLFLSIKEFVTGLMFGLTAQMFFNIFTAAGGNADVQIGLSMAQSIDPSTNSQITNTGNLFTAFAYLIFFASNLHHLLIRAIINSFEMLPLGQARIHTTDTFNFIIKLFLNFMETAILLVIPIMITLFLGNLLLAFMSKVMPQMNVFIVGMPFKILIGFSIIMILTPHLKDLFVEVFYEMSEFLYMLLRILSEGK